MRGIGGYSGPSTRGHPLIPIIPLSPFSKMVNGETTHAFAARRAGTFFCPFFCFGCGCGRSKVLSVLCVSNSFTGSIVDLL